jgi:hypothetical protein
VRKLPVFGEPTEERQWTARIVALVQIQPPAQRRGDQDISTTSSGRDRRADTTASSGIAQDCTGARRRCRQDGEKAWLSEPDALPLAAELNTLGLRSFASPLIEQER